MKLTKHIAAAALTALALVGCEKDGNLLYINDVDDVVLSGYGDEIVLEFENVNALAMTLYWTGNGQLSLNNPQVEAPQDAFENTLQLSGTEDFSNCVSFVMDQGVLYKQFTVGELNSAVMRLGFEGNEKQALYMRISTSLGANMEPKLSNVMLVYVTPYKIYMNYGHVLDSSWNDTGRTLYSPEEDGIYSGFMGVGAWYNWYLQEANGVTWGNVGDDGGGKPFAMSTNDKKWNFWFPGLAGCYYTIVDTQTAEWSALYLPTVTIGGDIEAEMTFNQKANNWYYTYNATAGKVNITLSGTGKQYNVSTGTDDAAAIDTPFAFGGDADALTFGTTGTTISVDIATSGETTITLDLSNSDQWTISAGEGGADVPTVNQYIYVPGVDDGISGAWTFDNYLIVYDEDNLRYGGACDINSIWGYYFTPEAEWGAGWGYNEGDAYSGTLKDDTSGNIPAPEPGQYVMDVSLKDMTYKLTGIQSVCYAGLNDDWTMTPMTCVSGCKYTATVQKSANTPWGVKIYINEDWGFFFGGGDGQLRLNANGFDEDNDLANGTYTLVVDLNKGTYSYVEGDLPDEPEDPTEEYPELLYMPGIDDGISGSWTFDNYLIQYNKKDGLYGGMAEVYSLWGYYYTTQADWGKGYSFDQGDALSGTLVNNTNNNIEAPAPGKYVFNVSLSALTYSLTAVESVSYAGLNDDWTMTAMECVEGCIYEAKVNKNANTPWGVKIYINENWDIYFGGWSGNLYMNSDGFDGDNELENGEYTLRVDLAKGTYSYIK